MATTRSAEKRNRQAQKRRLRNMQVRTSVRHAIKKAREAIAQGDAGTARQAVQQAIRALGKATSQGVIHGNNASRRISRLELAMAKVRPGQTAQA